MKVLIVDDSLIKIDVLSKFINSQVPNSTIDIAENITNAISIIKNKTLVYNLIVIDQYLPLRNGEDPSPDGGKKLLSEINRTLQSKIPNYIVGFSQYDDSNYEFSKIWKVIKYNPSSNEWQQPFSELIYHIKNNNFNKENEVVLPTIFVEGQTDKFYIEQTILKYFPERKDKVMIKTQKNAGSNWVVNQIVAWSHSMLKNENGQYIKCIGLLDNDESGIRSKKELLDISFTENQQKTFKCILLKPEYNPEILNIYKKGIKIEIDIESLFSIKLWEKAEELGYLENRKIGVIEKPMSWNQLESSLKDFILLKGVEKHELIYLKKIKKVHKVDFKNLIHSENSEQSFEYFKNLVKDLFIELKI